MSLTVPGQTWRRRIEQHADGPLLLAAAGSLSVVLYVLLWTKPTWLFDVSLEKPAQTLPEFLGVSAKGSFSYAIAVVMPYMFYLLALAAAARTRSRLAVPVALAGALLLPLSLLFAFPSLAGDVFDYLMSGRILVAHGANPYTTPPVEFARDAFFPAISWQENLSPYGPFSILVSSAAVWLSGGSPLTALIIYKCLIIASHSATACLVYLIIRQLAPERALFAVVAYSWNPLVVVYFGVDAHNDAIMLLLLAGAIYSALRDRHDLALPLLTLSALVKFVPIILLPFFLFAALRQPRRLVVGSLLSVLLAIVCFWPLWAGMDTFDGGRAQASGFTSSPAAMLQYVMADGLARLLMLYCFLQVYVAVLLYRRGLIDRSLLVLALYLLTISYWLKGWYVTWPLMLAAIAGGWPLTIAIVWSVGPFVLNIFGGWAWPLDWWSWNERWGAWMMELWLTASLLVPLAVGVAVFLWRRLATEGLPQPSRPKPAPG